MMQVLIALPQDFFLYLRAGPETHLHDAPHWHIACNPHGNGTRLRTSRKRRSGKHPVSLVVRVAFGRVIPGLWRSRGLRPVAAPSHWRYRECRAGSRISSSWRAANFFRYGHKFHQHRRELECQRNSRWQRDGGDDQHRGDLHGSRESSGGRPGKRAGYERSRSIHEWVILRDNYE